MILQSFKTYCCLMSITKICKNFELNKALTVVLHLLALRISADCENLAWSHLKTTTSAVGEALIKLEQLQTYVIEIKAILNSRPLSSLLSDPNESCPLTPEHLEWQQLISEPLTSFSHANLTHIAVNRLSAWQHMQMPKQHFWTR